MRSILFLISFALAAYATNPASVVPATPAAVATTYTVGEYAQGGVVFWVDPSNEHGLVAAIEDQDGGSGVAWSNVTVITGSLADGVWMGAPNTAALIALVGGGTTYPAASVCDDYSVVVDGVTYNDWYLPAKNELALMYQLRTTINTVAVANGGTSFVADTYWSSLEAANLNNANIQDFSTGGVSASANKSSNAFLVRAVRAF